MREKAYKRWNDHGSKVISDRQLVDDTAQREGRRKYRQAKVEMSLLTFPHNFFFFGIAFIISTGNIIFSGLFLSFHEERLGHL